MENSKQLNLFPLCHWSEYTTHIGWFYEVLASKMFSMKRISGNKGNFGTEYSSGEPDLFSIIGGFNTAMEIKSTQKTRKFKIMVGQWGIFLNCVKNSFPYDYLNYAFFIHSTKNLTKTCPNLEVLFQSLAKGTLYCVVLDYKILEKKLINVRKYSAGNWGFFYLLPQDWLKNLITNPVIELRKLDFVEDEFIIKNNQWKNGKVLKWRVKQFPVVQIIDKKSNGDLR
jgi:hypothetical protein